MRLTNRLLIVLALVIAISGCASTGAEVIAQRVSEYQRIALVCAPAPDHDASYAEMILQQTESRVPSRLGFLQAADCLYDVSVDTSVTPPKVDLGARASNYDAVVAMVYSYSGKRVYLDMDMIDVETGESKWHDQMSARDSDLKGRLSIHGLYVPTYVKMFYGK